jgi:uncharacterized protein YukE
MTTREEMQSLTEEIVRSHEDRIRGITELRETVKMDLQELRTHLEELRDSRVAIGKGMRVDLARRVADRKREVGDMLKGFGAELIELGSVRSAMSKGLKTDLAKSMADRKHEVGVMLKGFGAELTELGSVRSAMSKELKTDLAKSMADRKHEVGVILKGFNAELKEVRSELAGARDEWQKMTATIQSKRGGVAVAVKPPIEEIAEGATEITPETAALREQVFEYLANHPDGTRLVGLAEEFGIARIQIAKVVRKLQDENKVEKRDLLYFAV